MRTDGSVLTQFPEMQLAWLTDIGTSTLVIPYIIDPTHCPRVSGVPYTQFATWTTALRPRLRYCESRLVVLFYEQAGASIECSLSVRAKVSQAQVAYVSPHDEGFSWSRDPQSRKELSA